MDLRRGVDNRGVRHFGGVDQAYVGVIRSRLIWVRSGVLMVFFGDKRGYSWFFLYLLFFGVES